MAHTTGLGHIHRRSQCRRGCGGGQLLVEDSGDLNTSQALSDNS